MLPNLIALYLTEDVHVNNGLILEQLTRDWEVGGEEEIGPAVSFNIPANALSTPDRYPYIATNPPVVLPTFMLRRVQPESLHELYVVLTRLAQREKGLKGTGHNGMITTQDEAIPRTHPDARRLWADRPPVLIAREFQIGKESVPVTTLWSLVKQTKYEAQVWADAIAKYINVIDIVETKPDIFKGYHAVENLTARAVLMVSGKYGEGLYVIPTTITLDGKRLDWVDAINLFASEPQRYLAREIPSEEESDVNKRLRLLWRYYSEETKQGLYIHRMGLNPEDIIELFAAATNIEEFLTSFMKVQETLDRLQAALLIS